MFEKNADPTRLRRLEIRHGRSYNTGRIKTTQPKAQKRRLTFQE